MKGEYISIETLKMYQEIEKENKELHEKIDKAIEYLKDNKQEYGSLEDNEKIILDILNGDSND